MRKLFKRAAVALLGDTVRPRRILRGLPSGYRIAVSPRDHLSYLVGTSEPHLQRIIRDYVHPGDVAYDIGANLGYVTLSLVKQVGSAGKVYSFEPLPENLNRLRENVRINGIENATILRYAASDAPSHAILRMNGNAAMASLVWHKDEQATEIRVETMPIDYLVADQIISPPQFVKIDVEGAENKVLNGMLQTIDKHRPVIFLECSDLGREESWQILSLRGYEYCHAKTQAAVEFAQYAHADFLWAPRWRLGKQATE